MGRGLDEEGGIPLERRTLDKLARADKVLFPTPEEPLPPKSWPDIGPVGNVENIVGGHKSSAVWRGEIDGQKVVVKLPGARITRQGELFLNSHSGVFSDHHTDVATSFKAEVLVQELLETLGGEWQEVFAPLRSLQVEEGFLQGQEVLLVDYIEGQEMGSSYRQENPPPEESPLFPSDESKAWRKEAAANFWSTEVDERRQFAEDARKILLLDLITMNGDRHLANVFEKEGRLIAYDQGMAFSASYKNRFDPFENAVLEHSGGAELRKEERDLLEEVLHSDWLERVGEVLGPGKRQGVEERIRWMLENNKLYSWKTRMVFAEGE